jgi:hypothetical protein
MARRSRTVTHNAAETCDVPDWLSSFVVVAEVLRERGLLQKLGEKLRLYRQGGYTGEDVVLFLLAMFCSGLGRGIKPFHKRTKIHGAKLAAIGGRHKWPTQASLSRALGVACLEDVEQFLQWLLLVTPVEWGKPERHAVCIDGRGGNWHVFHWDHKVQSFRQRALPRGPDLPAPRRRLGEIAITGYPGRKRGEVQYAVSNVQHLGCGQWIGVLVQPGNGCLHEAQGHAHRSVAQWAELNEVAPEACVLISDGAGRLGKDGLWYELFFTTLPQEAFGASDVVTLYYGRSGIENQFACQNREFKTDYLYSAHLPGQLLALGISMFAWNMQLLLGLQIAATSEPQATDEVPPPRCAQGESTRQAKESLPSPGNSPPEAIRLPRSSRASISGRHVSLDDLSPVNMAMKLQGYNGFQWKPTAGGIECPEGHIVELSAIVRKQSGRTVLRFQGRKRHCSHCPKIADCTSKPEHGFRRVIETPLSEAECDSLENILPAIPKSAWWHPPKKLKVPGKFRPPTLLLAELRKILVQTCLKTTASVHLNIPNAPAPRPSQYMTASTAVRQRCRKTWKERAKWNVLPSEASVNLVLNGSKELEALLPTMPIYRTAGARE